MYCRRNSHRERGERLMLAIVAIAGGQISPAIEAVCFIALFMFSFCKTVCLSLINLACFDAIPERRGLNLECFRWANEFLSSSLVVEFNIYVHVPFLIY